MGNLSDYIEKYGEKTFNEKEFNDIDNLVFSELSYIDLSNTKINEGIYSLEEIGKEYLSKNNYDDVKKLGIPQKEGYETLEKVILKRRYSNVKLYNYVYEIDKEKQFSAVTFQISKNLNYICFEGTDEYISGWKEDGELACFFPVPSHLDAIRYVNQNVKLFGPKTIIGGHSKGGNLALVAAMFMNKIKKHKVIKVYNNDGPGLRKKEFESKKYKKLKKKYVHIVPDSSMVGILLRHDVYDVIKSSKNNILGHSIYSWEIEDDNLVKSELSERSKRLEKSIITWLEKHTDEERKKVIDSVFKALEDAEITVVNDATKIRNIFKIIHNLNTIDRETKKLIIDLIVFNFKSANNWN